MRLHALQYLRAVAALAVVYSHAVIQVDAYHATLTDFGSFGVDIFFVISGFIMVYIARPGDTPARFFNNRIRRVVPLYWFFTLMMAGLLLIAPSVFKSTVFQWDAFVMSLLFIPHYSVAEPSVVWPLVAPGWSLNYEMFFYLLFALSLFLPNRARLAFISAMIVLVYAVAQIIDSAHAIDAFYSNSITFEFIFGMLLAVSWKRGWRLSSRAGVGLIIIGFGLLFLRLPLPRIFEFGVPSLFVTAGCLYVRVGYNRLLTLFGDASYALYLSHIFTLGVLRKILPPVLGDTAAAPWLFVFVSMIVCLAVSVVVHLYVDNWLLRRERMESIGAVRSSEA